MKKQILNSFSIGDKIRLIQSKEENSEIYNLYKSFNFYKNSYTSSILKDNDIKFYYFKKDNTEATLNDTYDSEFVSYISSNMKNEESKVYYDKNFIDFNSSKKIIQFNNKCYFLDKERINDEIYQFDDEKNNVFNNFIKKYISMNYKDIYFDNSRKINNTSIPIYDLKFESFKDVEFLKLLNKESIDNIISSYQLEDDKSKFLFNSEEFKLNSENYDSILIKSLINVIYNKDIDKEKLFIDICSYIPKESFYRFLNPIGLIKPNESYYNKNDYLYSIDLSNEKIKSCEAPFNYYSLKNLKSPEMMFNYNVETINDFSKDKSSNFSLLNNIIYYMFITYDNIIYDSICNFIDSKDIITLSASYITNIIEELSEISQKSYKEMDLSYISGLFNDYINGSNTSEYVGTELIKSYKKYMLNNYDLDIRYDKNLIFSTEIINEITFLSSEFIDTFKNYLSSSFNITYDNKFNSNYLDLNNLNIIYSKILEFLDTTVDKLKVQSNKNLFTLNELNMFKENILKISYDENSLIEKSILNNLFDRGQYNAMIKSLSNISGNYETYFSDMFNHDNNFRTSGYLYGNRNYIDTFKNSTNELYLIYNYDVTFDKTFLKENTKLLSNIIGYIPKIYKNNDISNINFNDINIFSFEYIKELYLSIMKNEKSINFNYEICRLFNKNGFDYSSKEFVNENIFLDNYFRYIKIIGNGVNLAIYKISKNEFVPVKLNSYLEKYFDMLFEISKYKFVDRIKGEHYYKENRYSRSNVFSLNVKNSGLEYDLYSYNDVINFISQKYNLEFNTNTMIFSNENERYSFVEMIEKENFHKFIEEIKIYNSELYNNNEIISSDFSKFKYFKTENNDKNLEYENRLVLKTKINLRNTFEKAIRKSISRYIPANTTLWKIEYSGNCDIVNVNDTTNYFYLTALEDCTKIILNAINSPEAINLEYSLDYKNTWKDYEIGTVIKLNKNKKVFFRGNNDTISESIESYYQFEIIGSVEAGGNLISLLDTTCKLDTITEMACFANLFKDCSTLISMPEMNGLNEISEFCFYQTFSGCTSLKNVNNLTASKIKEYSYCKMFNECSGIAIPPEMNISTLNEGSCSEMFYNCTSLIRTPKITSNNLEKACFEMMFYGCSNLKEVHVNLPTFGTDSFEYMFMWLEGTASVGTFVKAQWLPVDHYVIPKNWVVLDEN